MNVMHKLRINGTETLIDYDKVLTNKPFGEVNEIEVWNATVNDNNYPLSIISFERDIPEELPELPEEIVISINNEDNNFTLSSIGGSDYNSYSNGTDTIEYNRYRMVIGSLSFDIGDEVNIKLRNYTKMDSAYLPLIHVTGGDSSKDYYRILTIAEVLKELADAIYSLKQYNSDYDWGEMTIAYKDKKE